MQKRKIVEYALCLAILFAGVRTASAGEVVPPLKDLRKPVEVEEVKDDEPVIPRNLADGELVAEPARLFPAGPTCFFAISDAGSFSARWDSTPAGKMLREPRMRQCLEDNRFGLVELFQDLPKSLVSLDKVKLASSGLALARSFGDVASRAAFAAYCNRPGQEASLDFLVLVDVGKDRAGAFGRMNVWETGLFASNPAVEAVYGDHADDFIDVWRLSSEGGGKTGLAAGLVRNYLVVSTDPALAGAVMELARGGESLAASPEFARLADSSAGASADVAGFMRMDELAVAVGRNSAVAENATFWADILGGDGIVYYNAEFSEGGVSENYLCPVPVADQGSSVSLPGLLATSSRRAPGWTVQSVVPYQPAPFLLVAASLDVNALGRWVRQEQRIFGVSEGARLVQLPSETKGIFTAEVRRRLTGEVGVATFGEVGGKTPWMAVLAVADDVSEILPRSSSTPIESGGVVIHSDKPAEWRTSPCWAALSPSSIRSLRGNFLVIASDGATMLSVIEQASAETTMRDYKDFAEKSAQADADQTAFLYLNVPEITAREFSNLSIIARSVFPRLSGLNSRPPLSMLRRYAGGMMATMSPPVQGGDFVRLSVRGPLPSLLAIEGSVLLDIPRDIRASGRQAMLKSADNLQQLWLCLQLYANRRGHFPADMDDLAADMRRSMSDAAIRDILVSPSAAERIGAERAERESYTYLSGVMPNDEPDLPIVFESQPWHEDFSGIFPSTKEQAPRESGEFQSYRLVVLLDGNFRVVPEKEFQDKIVPRLRERE